MNLLRLAAQLTRRDLRSGEVRVLVLALAVAVAAVSGVGFLTSRVDAAMQRQAAELLAADVAIESPNALPADWDGQAERDDLLSARLVNFPSVVFQDGRSQLVQVKAVTEAYPLRGVLRYANEVEGQERVADAAPAAGEVWVERRLLESVGLKVGDSLPLGRSTLTITRVLRYEPDRGADLFQIAPRVLMAWVDLDATGLITPFSRARYRFLAAGAPGAIQSFRAHVSDRLQAGQRLLGIEDARPEFRSALERAQRFLGLAALGAVLLAGAAVALAAHRYRQQQTDMAALMRCFGTAQNRILSLYLLRLLGIGGISVLIGLCLAWLAQAGLGRVLAELFASELPPPSWRGAGIGVLTAMVTLAGFALPSVWRLRAVSPLRVLRRDLGAPSASTWVLLLSAAVALILLVRWQAGDWQLAGYALMGLLGMTVAFSVVAWTVLSLGRGWSVRAGSLRPWALRFGLGALQRRRGLAVLQIGAFATGMAVILLLAVVRVDLLAAWQDTVAKDAPNQFLINVQPDEVAPLRALLMQRGVAEPRFYPMVRARLTHLNGTPIDEITFADERGERFAHRDHNLSQSAQLPRANRLLAGWWWGADATDNEVSLEQRFARSLGLGLGDTLRFDIAGSPLEARVMSLREVDWDSFQVNFFVLMNPAALVDQPATWVTSFHLPDADHRTIPELNRRFPTVNAIDVGALIEQVRTLIDRAALAVEGVFGFTLIAALVVFLAAFQAERAERAREVALLRSFGASRSQVRRAALVEFVLIGGLSGLLASVAAWGAGWLLAERVFNLDYAFHPGTWVLAPALGATLLSMTGLLNVRRVLAEPPLQGLQRD
ncbi:MAG: FtsX-like permease family protein [Gammaproteobacteria bacterium]|nr:FtsX-like permease family protein [Gammaproteobacteria bacterium]MCP5136296.1 FtsX-like permease family protein [Gammaproteobacteria bacterium]